MSVEMTRGAKALYLFPTKALAQDQVAELLELNRAGELGLRACTFDGDTPGDARQAVRSRATSGSINRCEAEPDRSGGSIRGNWSRGAPNRRRRHRPT